MAMNSNLPGIPNMICFTGTINSLRIILTLSLLRAATFVVCWITLASSLDPDCLHPGQGPECKPFDTLIVLLKEFFEKVNFEKSLQTT